MLRLSQRVFLILCLVGSLIGDRLQAVGAPGTPVLSDRECWLLANGIKHWVRIAGSRRGGIPVVLVHGGPGGNHESFERTAGPRLERVSTLVYYEQRGCGRSESPQDDNDYSIPILVEDLEQLRAGLGLERMILFGYSFGGELALEYALAHPDRVAALLLENPSVGVANNPRMDQVQLEGFLEVAKGDLRQKIQDILATDRTATEKLDRVWASMDAATVDRFLFHNPTAAVLNRTLWRESKWTNSGKMLRALKRHPRDGAALIERVRGLKTPALLLIGAHDRNTGMKLQRELAGQLSSTQMVVFQDSAHFPDVEEPELFAASVRQFLERLQQPR
ncbi:MAG TPA: alpha/beta fold hydrolase [Geothrix sp.]|nr:alpha/beta fold hydrolase [Geothrix sp.]